MKKRTQKMRDANNWLDLLILAEDKRPGTDFDFLFSLVEEITPENEASMQLSFGRILIRAIRDGDADGLRKFADALAEWRRHKPAPDHDAIALIKALATPPIVGIKRNPDRIIWGEHKPVPKRALEKRLNEDPDAHKRDLDTRMRRIKRLEKQFGDKLDGKLDGKPGRPKKVSRHNRRKKM